MTDRLTLPAFTSLKKWDDPMTENPELNAIRIWSCTDRDERLELDRRV